MKRIYKRNLQFSNQPDQLINIDWLTLTIPDVFEGIFKETNASQKIGDFVLEIRTDKRTQIFNKIVEVYYQPTGEKYGVLTYESFHPTILKEQAQIKIENEHFYSGAAEELTKQFVDTFHLYDVKISRLDICVDGVYLHPFINDYLYKQDEHKKLKKGATHKRNEALINRVGNHDNIIPAGVDNNTILNRECAAFYVGKFGNKQLGTKRSQKFARYYNKTQELLNQNGKKQYIVEYFNENGLDTTKDIFRFEMSLNSAYLSKLDGLSYEMLFDTEQLINLFRTSIDKFFEFHYCDNKRTSRATRLDMFGILHRPKFVKIKKVIKKSLRTVKIMIKRVLLDNLVGMYSHFDGMPEHLRKAREYNKNVVRQYVNHSGVLEWFKMKYDAWIEHAENEALKIGYKIPHEEKNIYNYI